MGRSKNRSLMRVPVYPTARLETHFRTRPVLWLVVRHCFVPPQRRVHLQRPLDLQRPDRRRVHHHPRVPRRAPHRFLHQQRPPRRHRRAQGLGSERRVRCALHVQPRADGSVPSGGIAAPAGANDEWSAFRIRDREHPSWTSRESRPKPAEAGREWRQVAKWSTVRRHDCVRA